MTDSPAASSTSTDTRAHYATLPSLRIVSASGADAIDFLHGQLTQDVKGLAADTAALAGYCTAKGRLLATLVMWRPQTDGQDAIDAPRLLALVPAGIAEPLLKRLRMFVLRAKVTLSIDPRSVSGVWMDGDPADLEAEAGDALPRQAWQRVELPTGTWIAAPAAQGHRWWWVVSERQSDAAAVLRLKLDARDARDWQVAELAAGIPWVETPTQDLFIPQTVNLDLIGGVSFTKGCYPGQEVVARSHYRGTVKRRMAYGVVPGQAGAGIAAGSDIYDAAQPGEPCGRVVAAAGDPDAAILFETTLSALSTGALHLGSVEGPAIQLEALPYKLE